MIPTRKHFLDVPLVPKEWEEIPSRKVEEKIVQGTPPKLSLGMRSTLGSFSYKTISGGSPRFST
jgi:hypothetical protein